MESVDKNFICRLCLLDSDDFTNVFEVYDRNGFVAADLITDLLQLNVSKTDCYPPVVCRSCLCNLTNFKHFKEQCITSKATYDNVFAPNEEVLDSTLQLNVVTIKEEEVDVNFSYGAKSKEQIAEDAIIKEEEVDVNFSYDAKSKEQIEEDVTEVSCGPILLKYEVLPFNRDDNTQECEDPLRGVSDEEANCEASTTSLMIGRGKSNSEVEKCLRLQVNEANNVKHFGEHHIYRKKHKEQLQAGRKTPLEYRITVAEKMLEKNHSPEFSPKGRRPRTSENPLRLTEHHFPETIPATEKKKNPVRQCAVCSARRDDKGKRVRRESRYYCPDCDIGLCVSPCFRIYHTKTHF